MFLIGWFYADTGSADRGCDEWQWRGSDGLCQTGGGLQPSQQGQSSL